METHLDGQCVQAVIHQLLRNLQVVFQGVLLPVRVHDVACRSDRCDIIMRSVVKMLTWTFESSNIYGKKVRKEEGK